MSGRKSASRGPAGLTEVKLLLAAGSLAATLLGWGALARQSEASQDIKPVEGAPPAVPPAFAFLADPLPTVAAPGRLAGTNPTADPAQVTALRSVNAPPPVQIITISKPSSGNSSRGGGGRTQSSK